MTTGQNIRGLRRAKKIRQWQLAEAVGVSESSVRMWEKGQRVPSEAQLRRVAEALGTVPEELRDAEAQTAADLLRSLLRLEREGCGIAPVERDGVMGLAFDPSAAHAPKLDRALRTWRDMRDRLEAGEISEEEYASWRDRAGR